jgi:hypothetical protein
MLSPLNRRHFSFLKTHRILIQIALRPSDVVPVDELGRSVFQVQGPSCGGAPAGELTYGGQESPQHQKTVLPFQDLIDLDYQVNNLKMVVDPDDPKKRKINVWLQHVSEGKVELPPEWEEAMVYVRGLLDTGYSTVTVFKNEGFYSFSLSGWMKKETTPKNIFVFGVNKDKPSVVPRTVAQPVQAKPSPAPVQAQEQHVTAFGAKLQAVLKK